MSFSSFPRNDSRPDDDKDRKDRDQYPRMALILARPGSLVECGDDLIRSERLEGSRRAALRAG